MRGFRLEPSADAHLDDIYEFSSARWSEEQAERYIDGLFEEFALIADRKVSWRRLAPEYGIAGFSRRWQSHVIYWKEEQGGQIAVFAILHERMHQSLRLRDALDGAP